jgi:ornithine cyclodeaminase
MLLIDAPTVREVLTFEKLVPALRNAFSAEVHVPPRHSHEVASHECTGTSLIMPAWGGGFYGVKVVNIWPQNQARGLPGLHSSYLLHDAATGVPLALIDGNEITSRRTAAASALAAGFLARADAQKLLVIGCGRVGSLVPEAMRAVRAISSVAVWDIHRPAADRMRDELGGKGFPAHVADDLEAAVRAADIVSCATLSKEPIVRGEWLSPGSHLDLIGSFTPSMRETDPGCFANAAVFVDTAEAPQKSGDLLRAFEAGTLRLQDIAGDLFDLCRARAQGRRDPMQRTVFKAVGSALEDLAAAMLVHCAAPRGRETGTTKETT